MNKTAKKKLERLIYDFGVDTVNELVKVVVLGVVGAFAVCAALWLVLSIFGGAAEVVDGCVIRWIL